MGGGLGEKEEVGLTARRRVLLYWKVGEAGMTIQGIGQLSPKRQN